MVVVVLLLVMVIGVVLAMVAMEPPLNRNAMEKHRVLGSGC